MVKLANIPKTTDEDLIKFIDRMTTETDITRFDVGQVDVVHRTSPEESAPNIILFIKKGNRMSFYH